MVGIIGAMKVEVENLKRIMCDYTVETISGVDYYKGMLCDTEVVIAQSGVGKVNAAICTQTMVLIYSPQLIINIGVAGGLNNELNIGDVVIATEVVQHDVDTSAIGDPIGLISGINMINIPCSPKAVAVLKKVTEELKDFKSITGIVASGDQFLNDRAKTKWISETFNAVACEMEGGSIGQVCYINNVDFGIIRAVSDKGDEDSGISYNEFVQIAAKNSIDIIVRFLQEYNY
ncbi:MAG: 5'-methylthioadenosine/adenosylhomocysteine nucleosidase [Oscillospiraceae bacterium]|nr:5'-methylthioadenosine/adenosylhomocysteine nucleosidase [Oscillospiraceae bacterium]